MATAFELVTDRYTEVDARGRTLLGFRWLVSGAETDLDAFDAVTAAGGTAVMGTVVRQSYRAAEQGGGVWYVTATYAPFDLDNPSSAASPDGTPGAAPALFPGEDVPAEVSAADPSLGDQTQNDGSGTPGTGGSGEEAPAQPGETDRLGPEFSFDVGAKPGRLYRAFTDPGRGGAASRYFKIASASAAPNYFNLLGWTKGRKIEGVDVPEPVTTMTTTRRVAAVSFKYYKTLTFMAWTVNSEPFFGHAAGELLYMGCSGSWQPPNKSGGAGHFLLTYKFGAQPTLYSTVAKPYLVAGDDLSDANKLIIPTGEQKDGWDVIIVYSQDTKETDTNRPAEQPFAFSIDRLFPRYPFKWLGL